jgi:hypothetical protein
MSATMDNARHPSFNFVSYFPSFCVSTADHLFEAISLMLIPVTGLPFLSRTLLILGGFIIGLATSLPAQEASIDFANEVLPVLSDKCFACHGPDTSEDTPLKLDSYESATFDLGGYRAIDPEKPLESEILHRIFSEDDPMPPEDAEKQLTPAERELLQAWIEAGGAYSAHWAFVKPENPAPELPAKNAIDHFIEMGLSKANASWAAPADRNTLARRVALVLTGLPPDLPTLNRFLNDNEEGAYERLVDELLSNPAFGEHQARYWLDAVRYGDTHGLHLDNRRGIYPYRDWVVRAFNRNLPLDQFITWQLAGDLLPEPSLEQTVATGFVRMNPTTAEGGAIPQEFQAKNNFDRTETLGTVLLGMTLTCARCHTHKYDPISQTEYYQLFAFFNSTAENSMDGNAYEYGPVVRAPQDQAAWAQWNELQRVRAELLTQIDERASDRPEIKDYANRAGEFKVSQFRISPSVAANADRPEGSTWTELSSLPGKSEEALPIDDQVRYLSFQCEVQVDQSLQLILPEAVLLGAQIDGRGKTQITGSRLGLAAGRHEVILKIKGARKDQVLDISMKSPWDSLKTKSWLDLPAEERLNLAADRQGPLFDGQRSQAINQYLTDAATAEGGFTTTLVARDLAKPRDTFLLRRGEYNLPVGDPLTAGVPAIMGTLPEGAPRNRLGLAQWLTSPEHPLVSRVIANQLWQRVFGVGLVRTPEDFGVQGQRPTHPQLLDWLAVQLRDEGWDQKELLRMMVLSRTFRQSSARRAEIDDPENRLFARGPRYRLDAEVLRDLGLWSSGLLDPTQGGEGVKPYQPDGMWLAMAHPGSNTKQYVKDQGAKLYRRSLYVYWKRTSPHPMMTLFDAPDRESACVQRSRTTTALQSLGLLNETQRIEMSRKLAERLIHATDDNPQRLDLLFRLLASRSPSVAESDACMALLKTMSDRYTNSPSDAEKLLSIGDAERDTNVDPGLAAAWTQVCCTVMASDLAILLY